MAEGHITLWMPEPDPLTLAIVGKLGEEAAELTARCHRCNIQGLHAIDPDTQRENFIELQREIADVYACIQWVDQSLCMNMINDNEAYVERVARKFNGYLSWQNLIVLELMRQGKS